MTKRNVDIPLTVVGGRGPHGLALHLLMQDRGLTGYVLVDLAPHWLPLYGPSGPMQATGFLRSPRELDFSLGCEARRMTRFREGDTFPLANVYSLKDAACDHFNEHTTPAHRAPRAAFWRYANCVAKTSGADERVIRAEVTKLEPTHDHWRVSLSNGDTFTTSAVVLATGLQPHLFVPRPWRVWWQHLPAGRAHHAFKLDYGHPELAGSRVAVLGSSNIATWEAAIKLAEAGAKVTLLSRYFNPVERQLPFAPFWFDRDFIAHFMGLPWAERKRLLKKPRIPASSLPGMAAHAERLGVRVIHHARVQYGSELWGGVQLHYKTPEGMQVERFDHLVAATGASPKVRGLDFLADAARSRKAPIVVDGMGRYRPILDDAGRWKNLPPLYPLGAHALARAGHAANTLASATVCLPLTLPNILADAGIAGDALEVAA